MKRNKLLERQLRKFLPEEYKDNVALSQFLNAVNDSYNSYERDNDLANRAFKISEEEYIAINIKLKSENELKKLSISKLKETITRIGDSELDHNSDDLLDIVAYLEMQIGKRRSAEDALTATANRLSSLIINLQTGVLLEDETRHIILTNQFFCDMFGITASPEIMKGIDCTDSAEQSKHLFKEPDIFVAQVNKLVKEKKLVLHEELELVDGRIFERDYVPIFIHDEYKGHLWKYEDITERKKAEEKLKASEELWQFALEGAGDGVWEYNFQTKEVFFSKQYKKMLGYEDAEFANKAEEWLSRVHPDDVPIILETDKDYFDKKISSHQREYRIKNKEGRYVWILDRGMVINQTKEGHPARIIGTHTDITQRKEAEEELRKISLVASANSNGVLFTNADGSIFWCNEGFCKLTGFSLAEIIGKTPIQLLKGELTAKENLQQMIDLFMCGKNFDIELICYKKDGSWFWGRSTGQSVFDSEGQLLQYFAMVEDITHEKEIEQALQLNEEKYRGIIANMNLGLLEVDNEEAIQYANQSFCDMSGYELDEILGKKASLLFVRGENQEMVEIKNSLRKHGLSDVYEVAAKTKRGELKWWLISGAPRYNDRGDLVGSIGIHLDITEQKNLEIQLYDAREAAEQSAKAKETFLANMSHEIRTPMNAILGMGRQLSKSELNDQQHFFLDTINKAADHLLVVINDILDITKIEAGKLHLENIGFKPDEVINHCMQVMMHRSEEKGLRLIKQTGEGTCPVFIGDPYRLNQVLLNLVSNAIKFTDKGSVTISCELLPPVKNKQTIVIGVKDTGIGMDEEFMKNLFQNFTQEEKSTARKYGGTGLGMSISKQLVELMKGTIAVASKKGEGTAITIKIPFTIGTMADLPDTRKVTADSSILKNKKILLVEDNEMNRLVATTVLSNYGALISEVINGQQAVNELMNSNYDLVLMDVQMPVMDGLEATAIIRRDVDRLIPIIALTANAIKGESDRCLQAGMNDFVSKPFEEEDLVYTMAKWLGRQEENPFVLRPGLTNDIADTAPLYDLAALEKIGNGNKEFVKKMVTLFAGQVPAAVQDIRTSFMENNGDAIKKMAHRIKPSIDNMGISSLHQVIRQIEKHDSSEEFSLALEKNIEQLESTIYKAIQQLNTRFPGTE